MGTNQKTVWVNRTEIKSETSDRVYVVSQHRARRFWACSCPGWRAHRRCKHLTALGLPGGEVPFEVEKGHPAKPDFLAGYATYDPAAAGYGSAADWQRSFADRMGLPEARRELGLPAAAGWNEVRAAARLAGFVGGGSDLDVPLAELPRMYQALKAPAGVTDVVMVTDAVCRVPAPIRDQFVAWKTSTRARVIGLVVGAEGGQLAGVCDELHTVPALSADAEAVGRVLSI